MAIYARVRVLCIQRANWYRCAVGFLVGILFFAHDTYAQDSVPLRAGPIQVVRGHSSEQAPDSLDVGAVISLLRSEGYLNPTVRTVSQVAPGDTIVVDAGPLSRIGMIRITGHEAFRADTLLATLGVSRGDAFQADRIEQGIARILELYRTASYHLAEVSLEPFPTERGIDVEIGITENGPVPLSILHMPGAVRTSPEFMASELELPLGQTSNLPDPRSIRTAFLESGLFVSVDMPTYEVGLDSTLHLTVPVQEIPPGSFDFMLGYLPSSSAGGGSELIGSGHLDLLNPLGGGRRFNLALDRLPGQASSGRVALSDPRIGGMPLRLDVGFAGYQQDSTYSQQLLEFEGAYRMQAGFELGARFSREGTRPGSAGTDVVGMRQRIPRGTRTFAGLAAYVKSLDNPANPRKGLDVEMLVETGQKTEEGLRTGTGDEPQTVRTSVRQERLQMTVRAFLPTSSSHTLVSGVDVMLLRSPEYVESDLFRLGGARSLRGYDENRFVADSAVRMLAEYRILAGPVSYAFAFLDVAYIHTPELNGLPSQADWYPGYGVGMRWKTAAGVITASYAINNEDGPTNGRIHLGLAFGL